MDLTTLCTALCRKDPSVDRVAAVLGTPKEKEEDRWVFVPDDTRFERAVLNLDALGGGKVVPHSVDLEVRGTGAIRLADLVRSFGKGESLSPFPDGPVFLLGFSFDDPRLDRFARITAQLTGEPDAADTRIERMTILPQRRLK